MMTDQETIDHAIIGKCIVAVSWVPDISPEAPFEVLEGTFELESITLEGGVKLILSTDRGYEVIMAEIEESEEKTKIGIGTCVPRADLHIVGIVRRIEDDLYDYADVLDDNWGSMLTKPLLDFEGKRVEIKINMIGEEDANF